MPTAAKSPIKLQSTPLGPVGLEQVGYDSGVEQGDLLVRPGHVVVEPAAGAAVEVVSVRSFTEHVGLRVRLADGAELVVPAPRRSTTDLRPGDRVEVRLAGAAAFLAG